MLLKILEEERERRSEKLKNFIFLKVSYLLCEKYETEEVNEW